MFFKKNESRAFNTEPTPDIEAIQCLKQALTNIQDMTAAVKQGKPAENFDFFFFFEKYSFLFLPASNAAFDEKRKELKKNKK